MRGPGCDSHPLRVHFFLHPPFVYYDQEQIEIRIWAVDVGPGSSYDCLTAKIWAQIWAVDVGPGASYDWLTARIWAGDVGPGSSYDWLTARIWAGDVGSGSSNMIGWQQGFGPRIWTGDAGPKNYKELCLCTFLKCGYYYYYLFWICIYHEFVHQQVNEYPSAVNKCKFITWLLINDHKACHAPRIFLVKINRRKLRGYCTPGPYFWRLCAFSWKIKQLWTN